MFYRIFTTSETMCELAHKLLNNLKFRILRNFEILRKCLNLIDWWPSAQSPCQNENFDNSSKKVQKISHETFPEVHCFKWKLESVSNIL